MAQVLVRIRPSSSDSCIEVNSTSQLRIHSQLNSEQLNFDSVGDGFYSQQDIFDQIATPIITNLKSGQNGMIITLGQKNSGKSYSLFGNDSQTKGLISMIAHDLSIKGFQNTLTCYQIFNQQILDLLSSVPKARQLNCFDSQLSISQLSEIKLTGSHEIHSILNYSLKNRKSLQKNFHKQISSSVIVTTLLTKRIKSNIQNRIDFIELSGYQNIFNNGRRLELSNMSNKSTNSFIKMIQKGQSNFNYQQSKLTQIFNHFINSRCNLYVIAHVRPQKRFLNQTLFTLQLANKSKNLGKHALQISNITHCQRTKTQQNNGSFINMSSRRDSMFKSSNLDNTQIDKMVNNQKHLKNLVMLYEERNQIQKSQGNQIEAQKKILQQVAHEYSALLKNFPTFSQIMAQNMSLKQQISQKAISSPFSKKRKPTNLTVPISSLQIIPNEIDKSQILIKQNKMLEEYEKIICVFKQEFLHKLSELSSQYLQLQNKYKQGRVFGRSSIKDFIVEDQRFEYIKSQMQLLKQQNNSLRIKNKQLSNKVNCQGLALYELQHIKSRLIEIQQSIIKDQQLKNNYANQIEHLKKQLADKSYSELQDRITIKKSKIFDKSNNKINDTTQTLLFDITNRQILKQSKVMSNNRISISKLINKTEKSNDNSQLGDSILQSTLMKSYCKSTEKQVKQQKKEGSQLDRLRLILLKSKQKTNKTKLKLMDSSIKNSFPHSKSIIFQRNQYSLIGHKCYSRPQININNSYERKTKPIISERPALGKFQY